MNAHPVIAIEFLTPEIFELTLDRGAYCFSPGACAVLLIPDGQSRPYSIASGPQEPVLRFLIRHIPQGAVSGWLSKCLPGDMVSVSPPFGNFRPAAIDAPCMYVATGVGIAPFLSVLRSSSLPAHPVCCLYGVRHRCDAAALLLLQQRTALHLVVSREAAGPDAVAGRVTGLLKTLPLRKNMRFFLCGYTGMIDEVAVLLAARGISPSSIYTEAFFTSPAPASR